MRYLICSGIYKRAVTAGLLLMLPVTSVLALKAPDNGVQLPSPAPAEPSRPANKKTPPAGEQRSAPVRGSSSERVRADSAVSFPVDI